MAAIFPVIAFILACRLLRHAGYDWRESILGSAIAWGAALTLITEALSPLELITPRAVAIFWIALCMLLATAVLVIGRRTTISGSPATIGTWSVSELDTATKILLSCAAAIGAMVVVLALIAPPSASDTMQTYLPRAMLWISNRSVRFYPTPDYLQLVFAPWPSFAMMQSILLFGTDRLVNIFQALSLLACPIAASIIARQLGAGIRGQALSAIVCITIPQGVLEASGALNSYIVSFWMASAIAFLLVWRERPTFLNTILVGLAGGLALLSKGHAYIFLPPVVLACWWAFSPRQRLLLIKRSVLFVTAVLAINAPTFIRNYELTASPIGLPLPEPFRQSMITTDFRLSAVVTNVTRHASAHIGTPIGSVNAAVERLMYYAMEKIGIDPNYSIYEGDRFGIMPPSLYDVRAGNPLHFALILLTFTTVLLHFRPASLRDARLYVGGIVVSFILMGATIVWQTTTGRYHLPLFVLSAPIVGLCLEKYFRPWVGTALAGVLISMALVCTLANRTRSFLPIEHWPNVYQSRDYLYFADLHEADYPIHRAVADVVNRGNCSNIGIDSVLPKGVFRDSMGALYVYPIMALINPDGRTRTLQYTGVVNLTSRYRTFHDAPCAVICFNCRGVLDKWHEYEKLGNRPFVSGDIVVFSKDEGGIRSR